MTNKKKKKKQTDERVFEFVKTRELDEKLMAKLAGFVLNSKMKGISFLIIFVLFIVIALLIALVNYLF